MIARLRSLFRRPPLTVTQAASLLSKQAKKAERSRRIEKMNELRAGMNWEPFVPGGQRG